MSAKHIVSKGKNYVEVFVWMDVVHAVITCQKLVNGPVAEATAFWFVHFQVDFIPGPVVKCDNTDEDQGTRPGDEGHDSGEW